MQKIEWIFPGWYKKVNGVWIMLAGEKTPKSIVNKIKDKTTVFYSEVPEGFVVVKSNILNILDFDTT